MHEDDFLKFANYTRKIKSLDLSWNQDHLTSGQFDCWYNAISQVVTTMEQRSMPGAPPFCQLRSLSVYTNHVTPIVNFITSPIFYQKSITHFSMFFLTRNEHGKILGRTIFENLTKVGGESIRWVLLGGIREGNPDDAALYDSLAGFISTCKNLELLRSPCPPPVLSALTQLKSLHSLRLDVSNHKASPSFDFDFPRMADIRLSNVESEEGAIDILGRGIFPLLTELDLEFENPDGFSMAAANTIIAERFPTIRTIQMMTNKTLGYPHVVGLALRHLTSLEVRPSMGIVPLILSPSELRNLLSGIPQLEVLKLPMWGKFEIPLPYTPYDILNVFAQEGKNLQEMEYPLLFTAETTAPDPTTMATFQKLKSLEVGRSPIHPSQLDGMHDVFDILLPAGCTFSVIHCADFTYRSLWKEVWDSWIAKRTAKTKPEEEL